SMNACCQPVAIPAGQLDPAAWRRKQCQAQSFTDRAFSWAGSGRLGSQKASGSLFVARSPVSFLKSTDPKTEDGKRRSRRNVLRHGFTAETVIEPLESPDEYRAFEDAIVSEYLPQTPVEQELV